MGTLIFDLRCGEGVCREGDLIQCVGQDEAFVGADRCGGADADMGPGEG